MICIEKKEINVYNAINYMGIQLSYVYTNKGWVHRLFMGGKNMKRKRLFQKVLGMATSVILASSSCMSPIFAEDIIIEEAGIEASSEADAEPEVNDISKNFIMDEMADSNGEAGNAENLDFGTDFIMDVEEVPTEPESEAESETELETELETETDGYKYPSDLVQGSLSELNKEFQENRTEDVPELEGMNKLMYNAVKDMDKDSAFAVVTAAAAGYESVSYSAADLGISNIINNNIISEEAVEAMSDIAEYDPELVLQVLQEEDPDIFSWAEDAVEYNTMFPLWADWKDGEYRIGFTGDVKINFVTKEATSDSVNNAENNPEEIQAAGAEVESAGSMQDIVITKQPEDIVTQQGEKVTFSVKATGIALSYQWMYRANSSSPWRNFAAGTTPTIDKVVGKWNGWQVKCVLRNSYGKSVETDVVNVTFDTKDITITKQPEDVITQQGEKVKFSVEATGMNLSYQWMYRSSSTSAWRNFAAGTTSMIEKVAGKWDGWQVKCVIQNSYGNSVDTNIVNITFATKNIVITKQPESVTTQQGEKIKLSVEAAGTNLSYQWMYRVNSTSAWRNFAAGTNSAIEKVTGKWDGWQIKCVIQDSYGNSVETDVVNIAFIKKEIVITKQPEDVITQQGEKVTFSVEATGTELSYQWVYRVNSSSPWYNFAAATTPTIEKVTGKWNGWQVKCVIWNKYGNSIETDVANITFDTQEKIVITRQPKDVVTQQGKKVVFSVEAAGTDLSYQWMYRSSSTSAWRNFAAATTPAIEKVVGQWNGWQVKCMITDSEGNSTETDVANITFGSDTQNHTVTFVNASTKEMITTVEAERFEAIAGLPSGNIVYLPKTIKALSSSYYIVENGKQVPVNLEAVVKGSSASYDTLNLFFYVTEDIVVYVNA